MTKKQIKKQYDWRTRTKKEEIESLKEAITKANQTHACAICSRIIAEEYIYCYKCNQALKPKAQSEIRTINDYVKTTAEATL